MPQVVALSFGVFPAGLYGMNRLATFLNELKRHGSIADWRPMRAITGSNGGRYAIEFLNVRDADFALNNWQGTIGA